MLHLSETSECQCHTYHQLQDTDMDIAGLPAGISFGDVQRHCPSALMDGSVCRPESAFQGGASSCSPCCTRHHRKGGLQLQSPVSLPGQQLPLY